jgi:hypothetical protein
VFFAIWTVADFADANGFVRVDTYFRGGWGAFRGVWVVDECDEFGRDGLVGG